MRKIDYKFPPMDHQKKAMAYAWPQDQFAWFMDMGTGKTYCCIHLAAARYVNEQIDALVVFCPTPIKLVWESEWETFEPCPYDIHVIQAGGAKQTEEFTAKSSEGIKVLIVGIESLSQGKTWEQVLKFVKTHKTMAAVDESSRIKNPKALRTKRAVKIGENCSYRLIMTGTPITQGIQDLYSQFRFLNKWIIGCKSYFQFKNRYCIIGGFENKEIIGYQNTSELMRTLAPFSYSVKIQDCIDMPERTYRKIMVEPTKEQKKVFKDLKDMFEAEAEGDVLITKTILERLTRYQQVCGGNFPFNEDDSYNTKPLPGGNPKLDALIEDIDDNLTTHKAVIWARFIPEHNAIYEGLVKKYGKEAVVLFNGSVPYDDRKDNVKKFQDPNSPVRFIISSQQLGGMGQTWTAAYHNFYFSNSFSYEDRVQSERRIWRKGQNMHCVYTDIVLNVTYDKMISKAIANKEDIADYVDRELEHNRIVLNKG